MAQQSQLRLKGKFRRRSASNLPVKALEKDEALEVDEEDEEPEPGWAKVKQASARKATKPVVEGRRVIDVTYLNNQLAEGCWRCTGPLRLTNLVEELRYGLASSSSSSSRIYL